MKTFLTAHSHSGNLLWSFFLRASADNNFRR